jgi:acyl-CoA thioesterase
MNNEQVVDFFRRKDLFARHCGIELVSAGNGASVAKMTVGQQHLNGMNTVHGGAVFTLADFAFAAACNSHGQVAVAVSTSLQFFKAATEGEPLTATAEEMSLGPKLSSYTVRVANAQGELVGLFQGMAYRKSAVHEFAKP